MKNISENLYFTNKQPLELEYEYKYNLYKENEFTQNDELISVIPQENSNEQSSYVNITIEKNANYIYDNENENSLIFLDKLNELETYENLPLHIENLFNIPEDINSTRSYLTLDIDFMDLISYYNIIKNKEELRNINTTKKLSVSDSFLDLYNISNKKSSFYSKKDDDVFNNYSLVFKETVEQPDFNAQLNSGKFLGNYKSYNQKTLTEIKNTLYAQDEEDFLERFVGFYCVKYKRDFVNGGYNKLATRFVNSNNANVQTIKDIYVKYSDTYKYYIYPVYSLTLKSYNNNFYYDQVLLCGYPLITEDIEAIETRKPSYPTGPFVKINKNTMNLEISWGKPYERQEDIKGFQVYKRFSIDEPYVLIQELRGHMSGDVFSNNQTILESVLDQTPGNIKYSFIDQNFDPSNVNIYAICSIDAHGQVSDYSTQIGVVYDVILDKTTIDTISLGGAPLEYPNLLIPRKTKYFDNEDSIVSNVPITSKKNKFTLYFTPDTNIVRSDQITNGSNEEHLISENSEFNLSIFRVNGQKSILINNNDLKIKINNFS